MDFLPREIPQKLSCSFLPLSGWSSVVAHVFAGLQPRDHRYPRLPCVFCRVFNVQLPITPAFEIMLEAMSVGAIMAIVSESAQAGERQDGDRDQSKKPSPSNEDRFEVAIHKVNTSVRQLSAWLPSPEDLRKDVSNVLTIVLLGLAVALLTQAVLKRTFIIAPISLPKQFDKLGYNGTSAAQRILDEIHGIYRVAATIRTRDTFSATSPENELPNIQLPVAGISLGSFASELKELFHNPDPSISGEITVNVDHAVSPPVDSVLPHKYRLTLRTAGGEAMTTPARPIEDIDHLFQDAAALVVEMTNPYLAASYYDAAKRPEDAERMISVCLRDGRDDIKPWALNLRGLLYYERKDYLKAIDVYKYVNSQFPKFPLSRYSLAQAYIAKADDLHADAQGLADRRKVDELRSEERQLLADASEIATKGILLDSNVHSLAIGYNNVGVSLLRLAQNFDPSKYDDAQAFFLASTIFDPQPVIAHINLGIALRDRPDPDGDRAIEQFRRVTELDPKNPSGYLNWGRVLRSKHNGEDANEMFETAKRLDPNSAGPYFYLGLYQFEMEAWDAAEEMFRESIKISPRWPWYHYHLGRTLEGAGKLAAAIESFKMAVELFPLSGTMNAHLGSALAEASQQEKGSGATQLVADARSRLNLAVDLAPDDDYVMEIARQALAMLDAAKGSAEPSIASEDAAAAARDPSGAATGHSEAR